MWFKNNTASFCNKESSLGKQIGTEIHNAIEQYILEGKADIESEYPEEVTNALNSFILFRKNNPYIELTMSEVALTSTLYGYNGTIDAPNPPILLDWKSGKCKDKDTPPMYDEHKYQCAAYVYLWNENNPGQLINQAHIVIFAKDKVAYTIYTMNLKEIEACFCNVFLSALQICNYQRNNKTKGN